MSETDKKPDMTDALSSHLLGGKKHHDEDKNVETEEIKHLEKGADYLTTLLLQQGVKETKTKAKKTHFGKKQPILSGLVNFQKMVYEGRLQKKNGLTYLVIVAPNFQKRILYNEQPSQIIFADPKNF